VRTGELADQVSCTTHASISELTARDFDGLSTPAGIYGARGWLEACERLAPGPTRYVVARDRSGAIVGIVPLFLLPAAAAAGFYDPAVTLGTEQAAPLRGSVLVVGARAGYLTGWALAGGSAGRPAVLRALFEATAQEGVALGAACLTVQYLPRDQAQLLVQTGLVDAGELALQACDLALDLPGDGFDDYAAGLSASRRSTVRRDVAASAAAGHVAETMPLSAALDFAPELLANVQRRHGGPADVAAMRAALENQAASLDDLSVVFLVRGAAGDPVAYSLAYAFGDTLYARLAGLRHDAAEGSGAYFRATYYEPIRHAYRIGARTVHLGIGSLRPKLLRGGRPRELYALFRGGDGGRVPAATVAAASARNAAAFREEAGQLAPAPLAERLAPA
jgi:hypothetical protein